MTFVVCVRLKLAREPAVVSEAWGLERLVLKPRRVRQLPPQTRSRTRRRASCNCRILGGLHRTAPVRECSGSLVAEDLP